MCGSYNLGFSGCGSTWSMPRPVITSPQRNKRNDTIQKVDPKPQQPNPKENGRGTDPPIYVCAFDCLKQSMDGNCLFAPDHRHQFTRLASRRLRTIAPQSFAQEIQIMRSPEDLTYRIEIIDQRPDNE